MRNWSEACTVVHGQSAAAYEGCFFIFRQTLDKFSGTRAVTEGLCRLPLAATVAPGDVLLEGGEIPDIDEYVPGKRISDILKTRRGFYVKSVSRGVCVLARGDGVCG